MFLSDSYLRSCGWQAFERAVLRLLPQLGFEGVRLVGQSGDEGADVIGHSHGKRWLFQVKYWRRRVGEDTVEETVRAAATYRADIPVIISLVGYDEDAMRRQRELQRRAIPMQLWDANLLQRRLAALPNKHRWAHSLRPYQVECVEALVSAALVQRAHRALLVLATGLGKTVVAAEAIRRIRLEMPWRVLVLAHTNALVYQLERAFWPFLAPDVSTAVWNGYEKPTDEELAASPFIFASIQTVYSAVSAGRELPSFECVLVDECHHAGSESYRRTLENLGALGAGPAFLAGLTATPWRSDDNDLRAIFGDAIAKVDIVDGLKRGYLANIDYRMYTDNIRWDALRALSGEALTPKAINRTLFITEWDDAVVRELAAAWREQHRPRAIVFCGTIDHAVTMRDRINAMGFARAGALYSDLGANRRQTAPERARILADFHDGAVGVLCTVDVLNEGVDIPDVNIVVFQRVTHSRRVFVQQLGRGLRIAPGKDRVIVLDFVSDIRRFAAGIIMHRQLGVQARSSEPRRVSINHTVSFRRVGGADPKAEGFLREWLDDVTAVEEAGDDTAILKFPPLIEEDR